MTTPRDAEPRIRAFVAEGEFELPPRVYDSVRAAVDRRPRNMLVPVLRGAGANRLSKLAAGLVLVVAAVVTGYGLRSGGIGGSVPSASPAASMTRSPTTAAPSETIAAAATEAWPYRTAFAFDGLRIKARVPIGWASFLPDYPNYVSRSWTGPQGAEAQVSWVGYSARGGAGCWYLRQQHAEPTLDAMAAAVASVPGTRLTAAPVDATVGGHRAVHLAFVVEDDVGCDPGFFFSYPNLDGGMLWPETFPGDTVRVWIVEAAPGLLFVEGKTHPDIGPEAEAELDREIRAIVDSITFE